MPNFDDARPKPEDIDWLRKHLTEKYPSGLPGSGLEDIPQQDRCHDPSHEAPSHMVVPQGKRYRHVCPTCRQVSYIYPTQITFEGA